MDHLVFRRKLARWPPPVYSRYARWPAAATHTLSLGPMSGVPSLPLVATNAGRRWARAPLTAAAYGVRSIASLSVRMLVLLPDWICDATES